MKRRRTSAQRRAAQRLARLGRSVRVRAAGDGVRPVRAPGDVSAPTPPRWAKLLEGFGPSAAGWEKLLPDFEVPVADFELPAVPLPGVGVGGAG